MFTQTDLGRRIHDARKAQGLTQEHLGSAVGVSAQAVSKWELGESVPDTMLIPRICEVLGVTADHLLGVDNAIGIDALGSMLADRVDSAPSTSQNESLMRALRWLYVAGSKTPSIPSIQDVEGAMVTVIRNQGRITGIRIFDSNGLACTVMNSILESGVDEELLDTIRMVTGPTHWGIFHYLIGGPQKRDVILENVTGSAEEIGRAIEDLVDTGILVQRRNGYDFAEDYRAVAVLFVLLAMCSMDRLRLLSMSSQEGELPTESVNL